MTIRSIIEKIAATYEQAFPNASRNTTPEQLQHIIAQADAVIARANLPAEWANVTVEELETCGPRTYVVKGMSLERFEDMVGAEAAEAYRALYVRREHAPSRMHRFGRFISQLIR